jgi:hypothetical protein
MKNEIIHWFDADYTLWNTNSKWWIVDKKNPSKPILRIKPNDGYLILSGNYKNDNHYFTYNGFSGWLPNELFVKIQRIKSIEMIDIGLSLREYNDNDLIDKQTENLFVYINNIIHLSGTKDIINILTARGNKKAHKKILNKLKDNLDKHNIKLTDFIFVNDPTVINSVGTTSEKKMNCILQNIIGYKIEDSKFEPIILDKYKVSNFYDDEDANIEECKNINIWLQKYLINTIPWLKQKIEEYVSIYKPELYLNLVTTNKLNPFITNKIDIKII